MTDSLWIAVHAFDSRVLMSVSVDETLLPRKVNLSNGYKLSKFYCPKDWLWEIFILSANLNLEPKTSEVLQWLSIAFCEGKFVQ